MATLVWTDAFISVNTIDQSDHLRSLTFPFSAEMLDETAMGTAKTRVFKPGLFAWQMDAEFYHDTADADLDEQLFALVGAASFVMVVRPNASSGASSTNPSFTGNAVLESYPIISGAVGEMAIISCTFMSAGVLTRAET